MKLLVDIGNSRIKHAWLRAGRLQGGTDTAYGSDRIEAFCDRELAAMAAPDAIRVANVAGAAVADEFSAWCRRHWQLTPVFMAPERAAGGVHNAYTDVTEMGVDRWLAMVAAHRQQSVDLCIVSAGTALTADAVTAAGEHLGGLIVAGPALMQQALREATDGVRVNAELPADLALGHSTRAAVAAGSAYAAAGLIEYALRQLAGRATTAQGWQLVMTGGAAAAVAPLCTSVTRIEPDLVLQGLAWYAEQSS